MAEETTETGTAQEAGAAKEAGSQPHGGDGTDWKAEARKWEARAKENSKAAKEAESLRERAERAEGELSGLKAAGDRAKAAREVAAETGLPVAVVERLGGSTRDELAEAAKAVKDAVPQASSRYVSGDGKSPGSAAASARDSFAEYMRNFI
jgi:dsDNA-specific endonuclease/ATPase MutS2